jgi:chaperonin GroEL
MHKNALSNVMRLLRTRRCLSTQAKELKFGDDGRAAMARGVNILAKAVAATLGPKGRNVIIEQSFGGPKITKDGVTVAKAITLEDRFENMGAKIVQDVASKTNDAAGDGTTTATILARAIYVEGLKCIASGVNPAELRKGVQAAVNEVIDYLKVNATKLTTSEQITQVATISANGDRHIGALISEAMAKVGKEGVITVQDGKTISDELTVTEGMKLDRGFISPYFINETKKQEVHFENAYVLISEKKITMLADILPSLELVARERRPLLIVAEDVDGEALAALILNKLRGQIAVCAVKAPGFGDNRKAVLEDLAVLTGGRVFCDETGVKLERPDAAAHFGVVKSVTVTKDDAVLLNGQGAAASVHERCELIRRQIADTTSEYEKEKLQERLAKLSGGVAVIKVGGASEVEVSERKDRFVDALNATKAAVEEGVIPGGGSALIKAYPRLQEMAAKEKNNDVRLGIKIVSEAIQAPVKTIVDNAGEHGAVVAGEILKKADVFAYGYNAATSKYVDMIADGIIDPLKVVRTALSDAASVASLLTTTEAMIVEAPKGAAEPMPVGGGNQYDL